MGFVRDDQTEYIWARVIQPVWDNVTGLYRNEVGADGARALADALKQNTALRELKLEGNNVGIDEAMELADAIKQNSTLQKLDLEWTGIGPETKVVPAALKQSMD